MPKTSFKDRVLSVYPCAVMKEDIVIPYYFDNLMISDEIHYFKEKYNSESFEKMKIFKILVNNISRDYISGSIINEDKAWKHAWTRIQQEMLRKLIG